MEFKEFLPIEYEDLIRGDLVRFDYSSPSFFRLYNTEYIGFVDNLSSNYLRISMSNPSRDTRPSLFKTRQYKDFERVRIRNLKRLEVILTEDLSKGSFWD